jgi:dTDP-4-dehydrorhamnose reductase
MTSLRILLLGANGLLGGAFQLEFQRRSMRATCLDRSGCDVTYSSQVEEAFDRYSPQVVINCTAYTKVDLAETEQRSAFATNALAVGTIAQECKRHGAKLIHFSTDFVFDGESRVPYQPGDTTNPLSAYGQSKLEGEVLLRAIDPPGWMILRTSWLFGATGACFPKMVVDRARRGEPLKIVNDQIGCPTYAPDLAAATLDLIAAGAAGIHHVTNSGQGSWFEFATAIAKEFGLDADIQPITTAQFRQMRPNQAIRPGYSVMGDARLQSILGRAMPAWGDALRRFGESMG